MGKPRLKDSAKLPDGNVYPLGEIPDSLVITMASRFVYLLHIGRSDLNGSDWNNTFAAAVDGQLLHAPLGLVDVLKDDNGWSLKTVKSKVPSEQKVVRLISGRCSPGYSFGIKDPRKNIQKTGDAVLEIWNARVDIARQKCKEVRCGILLRSYEMLDFLFYEEECVKYATRDFEWQTNRNGNLEGINRSTGNTQFTWQPHGAQFTIHSVVPASSVQFSILKPPLANQEEILEHLRFDASWVTINKQ